MKHLRKFSSLSEYETFANTNVVPNVCFIENSQDVIYNEANMPFYIEALEDLTVSIDIGNNKTMTYSINGSDYETLRSNTPSPIVKAGQRIYLKTTSTSNSAAYSIGQFSISGKCNVGGNLLSLHTAYYNTNSAASLCYNNNNLFRETPIVSAAALKMPKLLDNHRCSYMFYNCTLLKIPPLELPATTLTSNCYSNMFGGCTSLIMAPKLPATKLASGCYGGMFSGCTSLLTAPELPATQLAEYCYCYYSASGIGSYLGMFEGCTSLIEAPELPATTLQYYCYRNMFKGCTSLKKAPILPATALNLYCYTNMFNGCSKLDYIKAMFTTTPSSDYNSNWVNGVAATGTFVKNAAATWNVTGVNGIPEGWTVETAEA